MLGLISPILSLIVYACIKFLPNKREKVHYACGSKVLAARRQETSASAVLFSFPDDERELLVSEIAIVHLEKGTDRISGTSSTTTWQLTRPPPFCKCRCSAAVLEKVKVLCRVYNLFGFSSNYSRCRVGFFLCSADVYYIGT